jgi:hypothetical protein
MLFIRSSLAAKQIVFACGISLALVAAGYCQSSDSPSLGDLARKQRQKQEQSKGTPAKAKKVVTNEDIPEHPQDPTDSSDNAGRASHSDANAVPASAVTQTGEQAKAAIAKQKAAIADLKAQIDKVQGSIHFVEANAYRNGVEYNKSQAHKQDEVQRMQSQLDEMKKNLDQMQEAARKAGFGSAVWDP